MITGTFPRVDTGLADAQGLSTVKGLMDEYSEWANLKVKAATALIRTGQMPYRKPPAAEVARRRKRGKAQRLARKSHR